MIEAVAGCGWSGHMPGPGGSGPCPSPVSSQTCPVTPSYQQISEGNLWPCPSYTGSTGGQYYGNCTNGEGSYPQVQAAAPPGWGCIQAKHLSRPPLGFTQSNSGLDPSVLNDESLTICQLIFGCTAPLIRCNIVHNQDLQTPIIQLKYGGVQQPSSGQQQPRDVVGLKL